MTNRVPRRSLAGRKRPLSFAELANFSERVDNATLAPKDSGRHVVMFSGGAGSWASALRVAEQYGTERLTLLFADTLIEDEDLYRFINESATHLGAELVHLKEGRDPWQVFFDERFLGNARIDPCSKILKRDFLRKWLEANCDPADTTVYLGYDWSEIHRYENAKPRWLPWRVAAPLCERPLLDKQDILKRLQAEGISAPRLYTLGFPHNNCGGFCVKGGKASFKLLLEKLPERYLYHEQKEQQLREYLNKDVSILQNADGSRLTMHAFRLHLQGGGDCDAFDLGGCGCMETND